MGYKMELAGCFAPAKGRKAFYVLLGGLLSD